MEFSQQAVVFIAIETILFFVLIYSLFTAKRRLSPILKALVRSLRTSDDQFGDEINFVTAARTRYRRAAETIEEVDAHSIAASELSGYELLHIGKWRVNIGGLNELMGSAPGVFITIGLLGTFVGLAANLQELGQLLNPSSGSAPGEIVERLGGILGPMSTAFLSSLGGVFYSLLFWLIGLVFGGNRLLEESESLLTAYLEQVVQSDCNRYSLVRVSIERLELSLSTFLSRFSEDVGQAIETAMSQKVDIVFDAIAKGARAMELYASTFSDGFTQIEVSGKRFYEASEIFSASGFATDFHKATDAFLESTNKITKDFSRLSSEIQETRSTAAEALQHQLENRELLKIVGDHINRSSVAFSKSIESQNDAARAICDSSDEVASATKQIREARLAVGRENKIVNELASSVAKELKSEQSYRQQMQDSFKQLALLLQQITAQNSSTGQILGSQVEVLSSVDQSIKRSLLQIEQLTESIQRDGQQNG